MYLFESSIDIDASTQQCLETWKQCFDAWTANENFPDFERLLDSGNSTPLNRNTLEWGISEQSTFHRKALWWRQKNSTIGISGVVAFHAIHESKTRVTFLATYKKPLQGVSGFWQESCIGLAMGRILKQFRRLVDSNNSKQKEVHYVSA